MHNNMEDLGRELMQGKQGETLRSLLNSEDGRRLGQMMNGEEAERAAKSGDVEQMRAVLSKVLSTEEGKRLAARLSKLTDPRS